MKIKTDPKKMMAFSESVSSFSKKVNTECNEINSAAFRCSRRTGNGEDAEIAALVKNIQKILDESEGDLLELSQKIEKYALIVEKLRSPNED